MSAGVFTVLYTTVCIIAAERSKYNTGTDTIMSNLEAKLRSGTEFIGY